MSGAYRPFRPGFGLKANLVQTLIATQRPSRWLWRRRGVDLVPISTSHVLDCGDGVRLTGLHTPLQGSKGLVVLIHGWEGSHESNYLYSMACAIFTAGYSVFRLNLRDHAGSYALNRDMFHSARMGEVLGGVRAALTLDGAADFYVVGFSLGGNFALRVGMQGPAAGLNPRLSIGISPAIHPRHTLEAIDSGPRVFHRYFLSKWQLTMDLKSEAWPGHYDFSQHRPLRRFIDLTRQFVADYTEYDSLENYFAQYTLTPSMLMDSASPLALITSADDSVIPFADFHGLSARGSVIGYELTEHGGHCGFIENWAMHAWSEDRVLNLLSQA